MTVANKRNPLILHLTILHPSELTELIEMVSAWSKIVGKKVSFSEDNAGFVVVFILKTYAFIIHNKL